MNELVRVIDHAEDVRAEALTWPERARALRVVDSESYIQAGALLRAIKGLRYRIADTFDKHIAAAHAAHKALVAEKSAAEAPLADAEKLLKMAMTDYDAEQERLRREEQQRREQEARKAEESRRLEEAAALERQAYANDDRSALVEAEALIQAPIDVPPVIVGKATPKVDGISYREVWKGDCVNLLELVRHIVTHPEALNLVQANTTAINQLARSLRGNCRIPGVKVWAEKIASARS